MKNAEETPEGIQVAILSGNNVEHHAGVTEGKKLDETTVDTINTAFQCETGGDEVVGPALLDAQVCLEV